MRNILVLFTAFIFISCASAKIPEYVVDSVFSQEKSSALINDEEKIETENGNIPSSTIKIIQISDFHSNDFGKNEEKLISLINQEEPDIIFITGDFFEYKKVEKNIQNSLQVLKGINGLCPIFYVSGNHEYYYGHTNECSFLVEENGGTILNNTIAQIEIKGINFVIAGIEDPIYFVPPEERKRDAKNDDAYIPMIKELSERAAKTPGDFRILLAHRPEYIDYYKADGVFDLILSGHAHGGQWRLPPFINGLYAPGQGLFPKYAGGRYDFVEDNKTSTFIVSRGLSHQEPFFPRFFNRIELVEILIQTK